MTKNTDNFLLLFEIKLERMIFLIAIFGHMSLILFNSKIRINIFSVKNHTKNTDNMFAYTFNKICANLLISGE
jgi:hypothetical protein